MRHCLPPSPESERRRQDIATNEAFYRTQVAFNNVIEEIRNAHDPVDFLQNSLSMKNHYKCCSAWRSGSRAGLSYGNSLGGLAVAIMEQIRINQR